MGSSVANEAALDADGSGVSEEGGGVEGGHGIWEESMGGHLGIAFQDEIWRIPDGGGRMASLGSVFLRFPAGSGS